MQISDFDFELPENLIAQEPLKNRQESRMLVVNRQAKTWQDQHFFEFPQFLQKGDVIVLNNTKVFPARLYGTNETGAKIEIFLVKELENNVWETLAKPAKRLKISKKIIFNEKLLATLLEKTEEGRCLLKFNCEGNFDDVLDEIGKTPLPPYIKREKDALDKDRERYQTVYASQRGAIAAPTAGLHFTPEILDKVKEIGVEVAEITLHVGYGTFEPVRVDDLSEHKVLPEQCEITEKSAEILNKALAENRRIIAIGTTSTRALESSFIDGKIAVGKRFADLTITPNYKFKVISGILTNFHLPQSSLLVLVSTFGEHNLIINAYKHAVKSQYRFYSYGDCMLIID
ncbi:MAG: tRNA preQ1(34) S-adenosylmethionine ribosyltransferase-isomerase QueA [Pyrinomonadaceae bacterium]|jgi:S-adenosylmethionine:tRNA ribosyltransferase-isomerase|nr:tRNA preQ1(34) S-adenosylmethionine ribosyltransferase-isomerase QueA [Pyrinomonadaceae bacterium]